MNTDSQESGISTPDQKHVVEKHDKVEDAGGGIVPDIPPEMEARVLRKLDLRIIPMICWVYLMNFMDRGACLA